MVARRRGEDIIDFSMGNPDSPTPPHIVEKLCTVPQRENTYGYSTSRGLPRLRSAVLRWYADRYAVDIDFVTDTTQALILLWQGLKGHHRQLPARRRILFRATR